MLEVTGLNVRYGSVEALRDVSIKVEAGGLVAILGANGAGKSTLLRTISGIARAASGTIRLGGEQIAGLGAEEIVRRGRVKGFIPWLITQRPAVLNKNVLSMVDGLVLLKLMSPALPVPGLAQVHAALNGPVITSVQ